MNYYNYMNKLEFLFAINKYLKASLFQCRGEVTILQVGIAKTGKDPPEASQTSSISRKRTQQELP